MTATRPNWRVKVKRGDVLSVSATYDSKRASWYESMGIMPVAFAPGAPGGVDPFSGKLERRGRLTHGHLRENDNHGGETGGLSDARTAPDGPAARPTRSRSPTSSTARATCCAAAPRRARPSSRPGSRSGSATPTPRARSSTRSPPAARPATARRGSPTRSPTGRSTSTRASSGSAPRASRPPPTATPGRRRRTSAPAPTTTSAASTPSCAGRSGCDSEGLSLGCSGGVAFGHGRHPHTHAPAAAGGACSRAWPRPLRLPEPRSLASSRPPQRGRARSPR